MAEPTIFAATEREKVIAIVGTETVDLSSMSIGTLLKVVALVDDDVTTANLENVVAALAALCAPSNPRVTKEYLLSLDVEVVLPFMKFALEVVKQRMAAADGVGLKNGTPPSS